MKRFLKYLPMAMLLFLAACSKDEGNTSRPSYHLEDWDVRDTIINDF